MVYGLAHYSNGLGSQPVIPTTILEKPPSAELRPDQLDTDTLRPYGILEPVLQAFIEEDKSLEEISAMGYDVFVIRRVLQMVDRNDYKRGQAPPGVKITPVLLD